jgi:DNA ligase (NAD+)
MKTYNQYNIRELVNDLNKYRDAYYNESKSLISNFEYDQLYDQLQKLEEETGIILSNSPTQSVGYEVKSELKKVKHSHSMLSLDKTKSVSDLQKFAGDKDCVLMCKMDGLTCLLTYEDGYLVHAETRGNGEIGEDITHNAKVFDNIPLHINYPGKLEIEGEAIITYKDFEEINSNIKNEEDKYKNPRNLASGSVRQLDSKIAAKRHIKFIVWKVPTRNNGFSMMDNFNFARQLGFDVVPWLSYCESDSDILNDMIDGLRNSANSFGYPIDGIVMAYNDIKYGLSLGTTNRFPRHSIAFKFYDEEVETVLKNIEWGMGKHGTLTPVAVFVPVEIDGTTVERASLHNVSIMNDLELSYGDTITVYKANQIIPQVLDNLDRSLHDLCVPPEKCPICGAGTKLVKENDTQVLICTNPDCKGKLLGKLCNFVSRDAHDIRGLSEATLQLLIDRDYIIGLADIFYLKDCVEEIAALPGMGEKSVNSICDQIEKCRHTTISKFLFGLSIPLIGRTQSKTIEKFFNGNIDDFMYAWSCGFGFDWTQLDDFGPAKYNSMARFFLNNQREIFNLADEFIFDGGKTENISNIKTLEGKSICITGKLHIYKNRDELIADIEGHGGKVVSGVTKKTDYLLTNDTTSGSSKNKKAAELGIQIITEDQFVKIFFKNSNE